MPHPPPASGIDAKLIDDVALFTGRHAHFLADVLHVDLQLLDAAIV